MIHYFKNQLILIENQKMGGGNGSSSSSSSIHKCKQCHCKVQSPLMTCKEGINYGRRFWGCGLYKKYVFKVCDYFVWLDEEMSEHGQVVVSGLVVEVENLNKNKAAAEKQLMELKAELDGYRKVYEDMNIKSEELQKTIQHLKNENEDMKNKCQVKKATIGKLKKTIDELKMKLVVYVGLLVMGFVMIMSIMVAIMGTK